MFTLTEDQKEKLREWKLANDPYAYTGANAARYTYMFTPTSLGMVTIVKDQLKQIEIDLTEYDSW